MNRQTRRPPSPGGAGARFDHAVEADDDSRAVTRTFSSWDDAGWRALLLQRLDYVEAADGCVMPVSSNHDIWVFTAGEGTMRIDDGLGSRTLPILPGVVGMTAPGQPTRLSFRATSPMRSIHVALPAERVDRTAAELGAGLRAPSSFDTRLLGGMVQTVAAAAERGRGDLYADVAAEFLAAQVLLAAPSGVARPGREDDRVRRAIDVMRDRLAEPLGLGEIAGAVHLSRYHFLRVFKRATGETPVRYLTRLRIEEAMRLLDRGMAVSQVARRCGFNSTAHLSGAFLRTTGMRPSAYRGRHR